MLKSILFTIVFGLSLSCSDDTTNAKYALDYIYDLAQQSSTNTLNVQGDLYAVDEQDGFAYDIIGAITFISRERFTNDGKTFRTFNCADHPSIDDESLEVCFGSYEVPLQVLTNKTTSSKVVCLTVDNDEVSFTAQ